MTGLFSALVGLAPVAIVLGVIGLYGSWSTSSQTGQPQLVCPVTQGPRGLFLP
jgi:hypothetical protein